MDHSIREIGDFKYYTGSHPLMRGQLLAKTRPREFGNKAWASSIVLIQYLQENPMALEGLRVLEIGCGWGLIGIFLEKKYSCKVTCTDIDERVFPILKLQAELNNVEVQTLRASFSDLSEEYLRDFDVIIGAEVCYSDEIAEELSDLLKRSLKGNLKRFLIADPGRPDFQDLQLKCSELASTEIIELPGTVNGKSTQVLSISRSHSKSL